MNLNGSHLAPAKIVKISILIPILLLFSLSSWSAPTAKTKKDTAALIKSLQKDSLDSKKTIDSLKKEVNSLSNTTDKIDAKSYQNIFHFSNITIYMIGIVLCIFLFIIAYKSGKNKIQFALGLPDGSVRAIIAILGLIFYILISLTLSLMPAGASTIPGDVTKTMGNLVIAISAFYFGSKTAEQGSNTATVNLQKSLAALNNSSSDGTGVPDKSIIDQAIAANKVDWIKLYNCTRIESGKKKSQNTTQDIDCIIFYVTTKSDDPKNAQSIPATITYTTQGKKYVIPTDIQIA